MERWKTTWKRNISFTNRREKNRRMGLRKTNKMAKLR
jgi:hypothetical protein